MSGGRQQQGCGWSTTRWVLPWKNREDGGCMCQGVAGAGGRELHGHGSSVVATDGAHLQREGGSEFGNGLRGRRGEMLEMPRAVLGAPQLTSLPRWGSRAEQGSADECKGGSRVRAKKLRLCNAAQTGCAAPTALPSPAPDKSAPREIPLVSAAVHQLPRSLCTRQVCHRVGVAPTPEREKAHSWEWNEPSRDRNRISAQTVRMWCKEARCSTQTSPPLQGDERALHLGFQITAQRQNQAGPQPHQPSEALLHGAGQGLASLGRARRRQLSRRELGSGHSRA